MCWLVDSVNRFTTWRVCSELFDELVVLSVAPGLAQARELSVQGGQLSDHVVVELLETSGETP